MKKKTLNLILCPRVDKNRKKCLGSLSLDSKDEKNGDVKLGNLRCENCGSDYPILSGVAILVSDVKNYLVSHVLGISEHVSDSQIPNKYRRDYFNAKRIITKHSTHIEEDLESKRVNALYLATHYLKSNLNFPKINSSSSLIEKLISDHWDKGPMSRIENWVSQLSQERGRKFNFLELGCGVGGLLSRVHYFSSSYLGVDSSFSSIAWARKINLGLNQKIDFSIPADLLVGPLGREISIPKISISCDADFIVSDLNFLPLKEFSWDCVASLNTIDMLNNPESLPITQRDLLSAQGIAIQSSPYVWHSKVAATLRKRLPKDFRLDSANAVEWIYEENGLKKIKSESNVPWLFLKHNRQLEIYSAHVFSAIKA